MLHIMRYRGKPATATTRLDAKKDDLKSPPAAREISLVPSRPGLSPPPSSSASSPSTSTSTTSVAPLMDKHFKNMELHCTISYWKVYNAVSTFGASASVFVFEKKNNIKAAPRLSKANKLTLLDILRYDVNNLATLQHPRILRTMHPLEESKDYMSFATEPIYTNLENLIPEEGIDPIEMKLGVLQLIDGLSYMHNSAKMLHGNLTPSAIFVTPTRLWKIGGLGFSVFSKDRGKFPCFPWSRKLNCNLQPDLDFLAPEYLTPTQPIITPAADVFSLGVLICWIYAGGKRLIDAKNNLETHAIICGQLNEALNCISAQLGANLKESLTKVLSMEVDVRPSVQLLALIKHFDDPVVSTLRQLDDLPQEFDPTNKSHFISHTLHQSLQNIPEALWFARILPRLTEQIFDSPDLYGAVARPLFYMLEKCENHNVAALRSWMRRLVEYTNQKPLRSYVLENMGVLFKRLGDEKVSNRLLDIIVHSISSDDPTMQTSALRGLINIGDHVTSQYVGKRLIPAIDKLGPFVNDNVPRQLDLLATLASISDNCDAAALHSLMGTVKHCTSTHPVIIHAKSRLVQRIVTRDPTRLRNAAEVANSLLNPLVAGISTRLNELSPAHFDDVLSSIRILLDLIEQLRYEPDPERPIAHRLQQPGGLGKMSFLSADGRLEDRGRRESKDSRGSIESDVSIRIAGWGSTLDELNTTAAAATTTKTGRNKWRIGNGSDVSDESCHSAMGNAQNGTGAVAQNGQRGRRQSWLEGYGHSCSLEQGSAGSSLDARPIERSASTKRNRNSERRSRTRSPTSELLLTDPSRPASGVPPARPSSFSNLGHNLVLTYRNFWQKE